MGSFEILSTDSCSAARLGVLTTAHGKVETPVFMPVGSSGAVKGITPQQLEETGSVIVLANTYHLLLRPGIEAVEKAGGLHKLMGWNKPILTDSGGYQVFSLSPLAKIDDEGVEFASHIDGAKIYLNAEIATGIQNRLGADIIMCFDQCTPFPCSDSQLKKATERSIQWAKRARDAHNNPDQLLFGIVQGGTDLLLRELCAGELVELDFGGYAIGGLGVGEGHQEMIRIVSGTTRVLPEDKPRYLMGVGTPADIIAAVRAGVDMFDCVLPTRNGRNGFAFTENGPVRLRNNAHISDTSPIEACCDCYCCRNFSRASLRHFFNVGEMLGPILVSLHNLRFYQRLMVRIKQVLKEDKFAEWAEEQLKNGY
ncbi:MAG: tRNA guanosine(34) transglycosylase Tgt [Phycisphaerae bacterium]|nr:tRNA guanosine(34) transglycosylase Tgt [Phycisphaerae bacterium]MDD5381196.1 tRNA guanosine(34) transglycosylase Tgt [Phycisphaerae bacterium]